MIDQRDAPALGRPDHYRLPLGTVSIRALATIALALTVSTSVLGAEIARIDSKDSKTRIDLVGEIAPGDGDKLKAHIAAANAAKRVVVAIRLDSPGGNLVEGVNLSELVKFGRIATSVRSGHTCASACFIVFAAGNEKFASYNTKIGVHGASDEKGQEVGAATVTMSRILKSLGVPPGILGKLVVTPPSDMVWLTVDDLRSMSVTMFGKPQQLPNVSQAPNSPLDLSPDPVPQQLPPQHPPPPQQLPPSSSAAANPGIAWDTLVKVALDLSKEQNGGKARVSRRCQPEYRICIIAIFFQGKNSAEMMVRTTEDPSGKMLQRDFCSFNDFGDVRTCTDWDASKTTKEMKNSKGEWISID
jgi:hypothetical protein